jgi:Esterase FrsA-like
MSKMPKYFMYFPGNYRWSAAFVNMLGRGSFGGADIGELHKIGRLLEGTGGEDDEAWFAACTQVAHEVRGHAERFRQTAHPVSAAAFYLRACHYYQMGERFRTPKDSRALDTYRTGIECFHQFVALTDTKIEIVEVSLEGGSLPGYFVHAQNAKAGRKPCVVFFDGLDVTKEIQFIAGVPDLIRRGISVLVVDGPGTGEAIRFRKLYLRHDYEVVGSACIDFLERRADVDPKRIGIVAISLGGYYAPRCASLEPRFAACIAWGAIWDYHAVWKRRIEASFKASLSVPGHHIMWILGVDTLDEALRRLEHSVSTAWCRTCAARFSWFMAKTTSKFRSRMRRRCTTPADHPTRRCVSSPATKAGRNIASATTCRSAVPRCGTGSRTSWYGMHNCSLLTTRRLLSLDIGRLMNLGAQRPTLIGWHGLWWRARPETLDKCLKGRVFNLVVT